MDNENATVTEEATQVAKKLVIKRKPVAKKTVKVQAAKEAETKTAEEKPVEKITEVKAQSEPQVEAPAEEKSQDDASKKRRGRPPKQKKSDSKSAKKEIKADTEKTEPVKEESEKAEPEKAVPEKVETAEKEAPAAEQKAEEQTSESQQNDHRFNNRNQRNQKNKNRNFDKQFNNNNGKQEQQQRNNQKKALTMEEISITDEEYADHLNHRIIIGDLVTRPADELKERLAEMAGTSVDDYLEYKKQEVIVELLKTFSRNGGVIYATGTLEILSDGYGFLRSPLNSYLSGPEDVYVSPAIIKFLNLKTGDTIEGMMRTPKDNERFFAIAKIATVNGDAPIVAKTRTSFDNLIPLYPDQRINLETERTDNDVSMRIINLFCPIGKGQRALITAPPRTGKTILLQQIANSITTNHPEIKLMVLLVDERPEEVTDMRRNVRGEVIASTFDEQATRHVTVAEMVIEKAKRLVEHGKDVVILLDSITRLARAYNQTVPASGKILSGGVDSNALHKPKRFFGAARNIENGGSLTIIASALIETGSRMDEVIFEEFKGTGNSEIVLDRRMADRRLYPAINIKKSGTRREDLILSKDEAARIWILRNAINDLEDLEMTEFLIDKMRKTKNNEAFLRSMNTGTVPMF
ncbi:MAG: transcription termination factor Rho [Spirochaetales bacterium]|nr:transcription termination factor Rho [Spirochaetales bacterium]